MKKCKQGYYYCNTSKKCKKIPKGHHVMPSGYLMRDSEHEEEGKKNGNGDGNNSNGNGNGNGGSNGGSGNGGGGGVSEAWSARYKRSIDCDNPKGFSQKAHCRGRKKVNEEAVSKKQQKFFGIVRAIQKGEIKATTPETAKAAATMKKSDVKDFASTKHKGLPDKKELPEESNPRIPRKKGQPANSKKHSDLYTDENPEGTIHGLGFKDVATAKASVSKIRNSSRSHAHKIQAAVAMEQRAREMGKTAEAAVYRKFINSMKKKTKAMNEAKNGDHEIAMAQSQLSKSAKNIAKLKKALGKKEKDIPAWMQAKITDTAHDTDAAASYADKMDEEVIAEKRDGKSAKDKGYSLRDWFKGGGWKQTGGKYDGKPCAKQPGQTTKPYCRDADDRAAMSKDERNKRAAKKRAEDPNPNRQGAAKIVTQDSYSNWRQELQLDEGHPEPKVNYLKDMDPYDRRRQIRQLAPGSPLPPPTPGLPDMRLKRAKAKTDKKVQTAGYEMEGDLVDEGKKDACYHKVKSRYSVWPSAYASGALVKCRKVGAANWGNKTKKEEFELGESKRDKDKLKEISKQLAYASKLHGQQSKKVASVADAIEEAKKCWPGYEKKGTKKMFGKTYNNCVKKEGFSNWRDDFTPTEYETTNLITNEDVLGEDWTKKSGKDPEGGLNEKGRRSYERENPGSDLKRPSKVVGNKRRASFCARMKGMKAKLTSKKTANDPDSRINKSLRAWNC